MFILTKRLYLLLSNKILDHIKMSMFSSDVKWFLSQWPWHVGLQFFSLMKYLSTSKLPNLCSCMKSSAHVSMFVFLKWFLALLVCKKFDCLQIPSPSSKQQFKCIPSYLFPTSYLKYVLKLISSSLSCSAVQLRLIKSCACEMKIIEHNQHR